MTSDNDARRALVETYGRCVCPAGDCIDECEPCSHMDPSLLVVFP